MRYLCPTEELPNEENPSAVKKFITKHWLYLRQYFRKGSCAKGNFRDALVIRKTPGAPCWDDIEKQHPGRRMGHATLDTLRRYLELIMRELLIQMYARRPVAEGNPTKPEIARCVKEWMYGLSAMPAKDAVSVFLTAYNTLLSWDIGADMFCPLDYTDL